MITAPGGLWDETEGLFPLFGARSVNQTWYMPRGMQLLLTHLQHETDRFNHQGAQYAWIGWDEVTQFTWKQFIFLLSRVRSMAGVKGSIRATCNPDPDSWVAEFISWWIEQDERSPNFGFAIPERSGVLRWFVREGDAVIWADTEDELKTKFPGKQPLSVTFIPSKLEDNKILLAKDPGYASRLEALDAVDQARMRYGNWKVKERGKFIPREWWRRYGELPKDIIRVRQYWDCAEEPGISNDYSVCATIAETKTGFYWLHVWRDKVAWPELENAARDLYTTWNAKLKIPIDKVKIENKSAGRQLRQSLEAKTTIPVEKFEPGQRSKIVRAASAQPSIKAGNCYLPESHVPLLGSSDWVEGFISEHEAFPPTKTSGKDDQVDTTSMAIEDFLMGEQTTEYKVL